MTITPEESFVFRRYLREINRHGEASCLGKVASEPYQPGDAHDWLAFYRAGLKPAEVIARIISSATGEPFEDLQPQRGQDKQVSPFPGGWLLVCIPMVTLLIALSNAHPVLLGMLMVHGVGMIGCWFMAMAHPYLFGSRKEILQLRILIAIGISLVVGSMTGLNAVV